MAQYLQRRTLATPEDNLAAQNQTRAVVQAMRFSRSVGSPRPTSFLTLILTALSGREQDLGRFQSDWSNVEWLAL